jgi:hypothetical protein
MRTLGLCCTGISLVVMAILLATPKPAFADTYQISKLISDQDYFFYGMDDLGTVVIRRPNISACGGTDCYYTFLNGISTGQSSTAPTLFPINGTPCNLSVPSGSIVAYGVCINGREAFTARLTPGQFIPDVYTGPDPVADFLASGGDGPIFINGLGDIVWDDRYSEDWYEAIDTTPAVPEPGSLLLFGTGALAALGGMRRRLFQ